MSEVIFHDFKAGKAVTKTGASAPATSAEHRQAARRAAREAAEMQVRIERQERATMLEASNREKQI